MVRKEQISSNISEERDASTNEYLFRRGHSVWNNSGQRYGRIFSGLAITTSTGIVMACSHLPMAGQAVDTAADYFHCVPYKWSYWRWAAGYHMENCRVQKIILLFCLPFSHTCAMNWKFIWWLHLSSAHLMELTGIWYKSIFNTLLAAIGHQPYWVTGHGEMAINILKCMFFCHFGPRKVNKKKIWKTSSDGVTPTL